MVVPPPPGDSARYSDGSLSESEDIYMTINTNHGAEFYGVEPPRALLTKELSQNERQISVDPISLQGSTTIRQASFRLVSPPMAIPNNGYASSNPVPSPPSKLKFVSTSLPSSTSSSPHSTSLLKKIWRSQNGQNKQTSRSNISRMESTMDDTQLAMVEANQRRSKSLGEGRRSSIHTDDFDLWLEKSNNNGNNKNVNKTSKGGQTPPNNIRSYSKPPLGLKGEDRLNHMKKSKSREQNYPEDGFKCGKLCLFLPKGKGKPIRSISAVSTQISGQTEPTSISRTVSMERFECGSWGSSLHEDAEGDSTNLFFDLPMEMLRCSVSDMQSAVTAAFVFDNEDDNTQNQEDFNTFLEAQS
ncbi:uncharacterized protein LOC141656190 [Silene latifolia]|uniref:uncharacterized protein LOC141656190 n=1 Tax=Silene latifolia TaxID=37657 RepID=UPI003D77A8B3